MLESPVESAVRQRASEFRAACDAIQPKHPLLPTFPCGWCSYASILLGEYLRESGLGGFQTRSGRKQIGDATKTHAWLQQDGLIVDVTADQFPDFAPDVFVSRSSPWHDEWDGFLGIRVASLAHYEGDDFEELIRDLYQRISAAAQGLAST